MELNFVELDDAHGALRALQFLKRFETFWKRLGEQLDQQIFCN